MHVFVVHVLDFTSNTTSEANTMLTVTTGKLQTEISPKNDDLEATIKSLSDRNDTSTFNLMLKQKEYPHAMLNTACQMAMQLENINFVALLLRHGATPSATELVQKMTRFCEHPTIQQYLCGWTKENWNNPELSSVEWNYDYVKEKVII